MLSSCNGILHKISKFQYFLILKAFIELLSQNLKFVGLWFYVTFDKFNVKSFLELLSILDFWLVWFLSYYAGMLVQQLITVSIEITFTCIGEQCNTWRLFTMIEERFISTSLAVIFGSPPLLKLNHLVWTINLLILHHSNSTYFYTDVYNIWHNTQYKLHIIFYIKSDDFQFKT